jgi:hypothetical protein
MLIRATMKREFRAITSGRKYRSVNCETARRPRIIVKASATQRALFAGHQVSRRIYNVFFSTTNMRVRMRNHYHVNIRATFRGELYAFFESRGSFTSRRISDFSLRTHARLLASFITSSLFPRTRIPSSFFRFRAT